MANGIWYCTHSLVPATFSDTNNNNLIDHYFFESDGDVDDEWDLIESTGYTTSDDLVHQAKKFSNIVTGLITTPGSGGALKIIGGTLVDTYTIHPNADFAKTVSDTLEDSDWDPTTGTVALSGGLAAVTTDTTLTGDGTAGDPLTTDGGIGGPYWIYFSMRSGSISGGTNYFALALNGAIGSGGFTSGDPTNTADPGGWSAGYALQLPKGELSNLRFGLANGPGAGETIDLSIRLNAADPASGLTVQFTGDSGGLAVFGNDTTHTVVVPEDGYVAIKSVATGGASFGGATGRILFTPKP